jgi:uncharacterized protein (UPF0335 family)
MPNKEQHMQATIGHNGIAGDRLRSIIERIERLESERKALADDVKDIFQEAKSAGLDVKIIRALLKERKKDPAELEEHRTLLELYRDALGEYQNTPLGAAAMDRAAHA